MKFDERIDKSISLLYEGAIGNVTAIQEANQLLERLLSSIRTTLLRKLAMAASCF
ncbi:hypothetical protein [Alicyclobacillus pomorum]|uniref:hypothetical protein n=1 Tax=Alicyclobacillus pomorum TaxID=204470 RepID=UPI0039EE6AE2